MVTPRSPVRDTITCSGAQVISEPGTCPAATDWAIALLPRTNSTFRAPPVFTASGDPHFSKAGPIPIGPASRENACSARLSSSAYRWTVVSSPRGNALVGSDGGCIVSDGSSAARGNVLWTATRQPVSPRTQYPMYLWGCTDPSGRLTFA